MKDSVYAGRKMFVSISATQKRVLKTHGSVEAELDEEEMCIATLSTLSSGRLSKSTLAFASPSAAVLIVCCSAGYTACHRRRHPSQ